MATIEMDNLDRSGNENTDEVRETIVVKIGADVTATEAAKVCSQVKRVLAQLLGNVMNEVAHKGSAGASHPGVQQLFSALANAEAASLTFDPPRVQPGMRMPGPGPGMPGGPMGRA